MVLTGVGTIKGDQRKQLWVTFNLHYKLEINHINTFKYPNTDSSDDGDDHNSISSEKFSQNQWLQY